jgi:hypothetical protein
MTADALAQARAMVAREHRQPRIWLSNLHDCEITRGELVIPARATVWIETNHPELVEALLAVALGAAQGV